MDLVTNQQKESGYLCHPGCKKSGQCIRSECVWCSSWCGCGPGSCLSRAGDPCRPPQCPPSTHHFPLTNPFARSDCSVPLLPRLSPTLPLNLPISSSHQNHHQNLSSPQNQKKAFQQESPPRHNSHDHNDYSHLIRFILAIKSTAPSTSLVALG